MSLYINKKSGINFTKDIDKVSEIDKKFNKRSIKSLEIISKNIRKQRQLNPNSIKRKIEDLEKQIEENDIKKNKIISSIYNERRLMVGGVQGEEKVQIKDFLTNVSGDGNCGYYSFLTAIIHGTDDNLAKIKENLVTYGIVKQDRVNKGLEYVSNMDLNNNPIDLGTPNNDGKKLRLFLSEIMNQIIDNSELDNFNISHNNFISYITY